jgi:formylglycine-generating enzyme required for sulfatase activity
MKTALLQLLLAGLPAVGLQYVPANEPPKTPPQEICKAVGVKLIWIPAGEFQMGSHESAEELAKAFSAYHRPPEQFADECPRHRARITKPFYLGKYEVTVDQFRRFREEADHHSEPDLDGTGGWGYNPQTGKLEGRQPHFNWRNLGFRVARDE